MPQVTKKKAHNLRSLQYDALQFVPFDLVTLGASMANTAVQARLPLPANCKVMAVAAVLGGSPAGTCSFNIVVGSAAEGSLPTLDNLDNPQAGPTPIAASGAVLFAADQALTMSADAVQMFYPPNFDAVLGAGTELTVRCATNASGAGTLKVMVALKPYDIKAYSPKITTFSPATDL